MFTIKFHFREKIYETAVRACNVKEALFRFWNLRCQLGDVWDYSIPYYHTFNFKKEITILDIKES